MKTFWMLTALFIAALVACATSSREIRHPRGCEERIANPARRAACFRCLERPIPHVFLADEEPGERCVRR
ncbi:MAG TPA: hypothetical protein VGH20_12510 [Myxococcales bacterium]|jgi:hypothetical protein